MAAKRTFKPPTFDSVEEERLHRKQRLAAAFRLFSRFGFDQGVAGHITARDPGDPRDREDPDPGRHGRGHRDPVHGPGHRAWDGPPPPWAGGSRSRWDPAPS